MNVYKAYDMLNHFYPTYVIVSSNEDDAYKALLDEIERASVVYGWEDKPESIVEGYEIYFVCDVIDGETTIAEDI